MAMDETHADKAQARDRRVLELMSAYGADFDRWPTAEGLGRPQLDGGLQAARAREQTLDLLIEDAHVPPPSEALRRRIMDIPARRAPAGAGGIWFLAGFWRPAGLAAGALLLGLCLGQFASTRGGVAYDGLVHASETEEAERLFAELVLGPADSLAELGR